MTTNSIPTDILSDILFELKTLHAQVISQQQTINHLQNALANLNVNKDKPNASNTNVTTNIVSRRQLLNKLTKSLLASFAITTSVLASNTTIAQTQARLITYPPNTNQQIGTIITAPGVANYNGNLVNPTIKYGLVVTSDNNLTLSNLRTLGDCAVYATTNTGAAIYGDNQNGYGVYGRSATSFGAVGIGNSDAGVGVSGGSDTGIGVQAQSISGAPLNIVAGSQPTTGTRQAGDIYVDSDGNMWLWAKNTSNVFVWRKVQLV